jgi:hypothetical protein
MRSPSYFAVLLLIVSLASSISAQNSATISGVIAATDGTPLAAIVTALRVGTSPAGGRVETAANGSFTISALAAGTKY